MELVDVIQEKYESLYHREFNGIFEGCEVIYKMDRYIIKLSDGEVCVALRQITHLDPGDSIWKGCVVNNYSKEVTIYAASISGDRESGTYRITSVDYLTKEQLDFEKDYNALFNVHLKAVLSLVDTIQEKYESVYHREFIGIFVGCQVVYKMDRYKIKLSDGEVCVALR